MDSNDGMLPIEVGLTDDEIKHEIVVDELPKIEAHDNRDLLKREVLCYLRLAALAKHDDAREVYVEEALEAIRDLIEKENNGKI